MTAPPDPSPPASLLRLRPRPPQLPGALVRRDDVTGWEWTGLHLDGVLVPLWRDTSRRRDVPESPALRAEAVAPLVPPRGAVGRLAAAWVHTGLVPPPRRVDVVVPAASRRPDPHPDRVASEADLPPRDVVVLGGVRVTTVTRTAVDVARWVPRDTAVPALRALVGSGLDAADATQLLRGYAGGRGVREARRTLALALA